MVDPLASGLIAAAGAILSALAVIAGARGRSRRRPGSLIAVDLPSCGVSLVSDRYRMRGRPDALRRRPDGRVVPVELKSRTSPADGPPRSHIVQVWAYCLLVEETTGRSPPYGILRYGDGVEHEIPWGVGEREILLGLREEMSGRYDGRARPALARCARCRWRSICDARY